MHAKKPKHTAETVLPKQMLRAWESTLLETARIRGISKEHTSSDDKLNHILRAEMGNVRQLWEAFTTDRDQLPRYLLDPKKQTTAYLLGFHLPNAARMWNLLYRFGRKYQNDALWKQQNIKIWDFGCGTGAMSQTLATFLMNKKSGPIDLTLIDQQGPFLDASRKGFEHLDTEVMVRTIKAKLETAIPSSEDLRQYKGRLNIVVLGYVWNELKRNPKAKAKLSTLMKALSDRKTLFLVVEPANQFIARDAMELRNIATETGYTAAYPCGHNSPCPMLERQKDWCYSETTWQTNKAIQRIDKNLKINHEFLKYAGYIFASESAMNIMESKILTGSFPVVGRPVVDKQAKIKKTEYLVCRGKDLKKYPGSSIKGRTLLRGEALHTEKTESQPTQRKPK
ncbi:MAG: hypothetical protein HRU19_13810 [Pseudobacteriovorax sp.]|nr:hypothetical protein [Pseudobacteriovorax sp.]